MIMNSDQIEKLLRAAPPISAPPGLVERLNAGIRLPRRPPQTTEEYSPSFFKRWLPALSVAIWFVACLVILGVQSQTLTKLREENEALRAAATEAPQTPAASSTEAELARLRADAAEAQKLREEIARASAQLEQLQRLRAENQQLSAQLRDFQAQAAQAAPVSPEQDFFLKAYEAKCINNLKRIGLGARIWANEHNDILPTSFDEMLSWTPDFKHLGNTPKDLPDKSMFFCPASEGTLQYPLISPGVSEDDPNVVYAHCPRHNKALLCDGSVQGMSRSVRLVVRPDGKTVIGR